MLPVGGFTFKGHHSSEFGVYKAPSSLQLAATKKYIVTDIPGRYSPYVQNTNLYNQKTESIVVSYVKPAGDVTVNQQVRKIAGWLNGIGVLEYDSEPGYYYTAYVTSNPPKSQDLQCATFQIDFTYVNPYAYSESSTISFNAETNNPNNIEVSGTLETPFTLVLINNSNQTINDLSIYQSIV